MKYRYSVAAKLIVFALIVHVDGTGLYAQLPPTTNVQQAAKPATPSQSTTEQGVKLSIECPRVLVSGAANYVKMKVQNDGQYPVEFSPVPPQFQGVGFVVTRFGEPVSPTALGNAYLVPSRIATLRKPVRIDKAQSYRIVVNLTRYYDLSLPGKYQIIATWIGKGSGKEKPIRIRTKPLDFRVKLDPGESVSQPK